MENIESYFASFAAFVTLIPLLVQFLKTKMKLKGLVVQYLSWIIGLLAALFAWIFNIGMFAELQLWVALATGLAASLAANGVADAIIAHWLLTEVTEQD